MHRRHAGLALLLAASTAHALPRDVVLTTRAAVCPKDAVTCGSSLPSDFCCPKNTSCEALAGDTSALCCPAGGDCSRIQPISCNVRLQDPQSHADGPVFTSIFDIDLPKCGTNCCPFGYTCVGSGCTRDTDQSKEPSSKPPSSSASSSTATPASSTATSASSSASATTTTASTSAHTTTPAAVATTTAAPSSDAHDDHGGGMDSTTISIIGGTVGGVFLITAVLVTIFLCIRRRKKRTPAGASSSSSSSSSRRGLAPSRSHEKPGTSSDSVSIRARGFHISEPIRQDEPPYRTDFAALKSPSAASSISQQPVNARWSGSGGGGGGSRRGGGGGGAASGRHLTPPVRPPREPVAPPPRPQQQQPAAAAAPAMSLRPPSFPNPFSSPSPDAGGGARDSVGSSFYEHYNTNVDEPSRTGHVVSRQPVPPIRGMNASGSRRSEAGEFRRQPSSESIDVFADDDDIAPLRTQPPQQQPQQEQQYLHPDEYLRPQQQQQQQGHGHDARDRDTTYTTMSNLMDEAGLGEMYRGKKRYVPDTTPGR